MGEPHMRLPDRLSRQGYALARTEEADFESFLSVKKICFERYVDQYYEGWDDADQRARNEECFRLLLRQDCFLKVLLREKNVGFLACHEGPAAVEGVSLQLLPQARNAGIGSSFLSWLAALADAAGKPVELRVFRGNPARELYRRYGFEVYAQTASHLLMRRLPGAPGRQGRI